MAEEGLFADQVEVFLQGLRRRLDAWRSRLPKPTREQMLQVAYRGDRTHAALEGGNQQFWDALEADWRRKQEPNFVPIRADESWTPKAREWSEAERGKGRIFETLEQANAAYMASHAPDFGLPDQPETKSKGDETPKPNDKSDLIRIASDEEVAETEEQIKTFVKHQRDQERLAKLPPEDDTPPPLEWSPEFTRKWTAERQMASDAFQQATNSKPPREKPTLDGLSRFVGEQQAKRNLERRKKRRKRKTAPPPAARALNRYRLFRWLAGHPKVSGWSGLGMAGFALGIELSGAGKFAAVCYLVAWSTWSLAIYFSPWWDKSRKGSMMVMVVLGIGLFGVWREYFPQSPPPPVVRQPAPELNEPAPMITNAAMRISDERFARTSFPLKAGQTVGVTFYTFNDGPGVAHNYHIYAHFGFIQRGSAEEMERATESMFQDVYRRVNKSTQDGEKGSDISPNDERFSSVGQNSVASADALAFNGKKKVLVAFARIEWDNIQWAERCVYFLPEQVQEYLTSADHKIIWNQCKGHNDSGLRRSGSLL